MNKWYFEVLTKQYANFEGRARRKSFWLFVLFQIIVVSVLSAITAPLLDSRIKVNPIVMIYWSITLMPSIAIAVRRLHDTGRSGWWLLLSFIPILGNIILLIFYLQDSIPGDNKYGPNPKGEVKCTVI